MKKRKLFTLFLAMALMITSLQGGQVFAAPRNTDVFLDVEHSTVSYTDIKYEHYDPTEFNSLCDAIISLCRNAEYEQKVFEIYKKMKSELLWVSTMYTVTENQMNIDVNDEDAMLENQYTYSVYVKMYDKFLACLKRVLLSPCKSILEKELSTDIIEQILVTEQMTEEQEMLSNQEQELISEYMQKSVIQYTAKVGGKEMILADIEAGYMNGGIAADIYLEAATSIAKKKNEAVGEIYIKLVAVRNQIANSYGYSNYGDYAYENIYDRDYSQKQIKVFHESVKKWIIEPTAYLSLMNQINADRAFYSYDYSPKNVIPLIREFIPEISTELAESFQYMLDYKMYNLEYSSNKMSVGYTTMLPSYAAPYMFNQPTKTIYDFTTIVHESGHYNAFYWNEPTWYTGISIDLAEVHSQGLELLFFKFYDEIFGSDSGAAKEYILGNMLNSIMQGCMFDEFQQIVYANPNYTLKQINQAYMQILKEYGYAAPNDPRTEAYNWVDVPHNFTSPMYYISYAVSAAAALQIWESSIDNYNDAVDKYLEIVATSQNSDFGETLISAGLEDPLTEKYISELSKLLFDQLKLISRYEELVNAAGESSK